VTADVINPPNLPSVPAAGLDEVLRSFSGAGELYNAVAELGRHSHEWSADAVRIRSNRVLFEELGPLLLRWPTHMAAWIDALPAQSDKRREVGSAPSGRVNWVRTRATGWPPASFHTVVRERRPDSVLTTAFVWTVGAIIEIASDARRVFHGMDKPFSSQLTTARAVWDELGGGGEDAEPPGRPELAALRASGHPWSALADTAELIQSRRSDVAALARATLLPYAEFRGVLFHLGCVGEILLSLRRNGWRTTSLRPIGIGSGPAFRAVKADRAIDIWYEVGAAFRHYGSVSPYVLATSELGEGSRPIGADIGLFEGKDSALLFECKCSLRRDYVVREGYEQALAYLAECRTALVENAASVVVGPDEVVHTVGEAQTVVGKISIIPAAGLDTRVTDWLIAKD